jgi:hypothetical protein
MDSFHFIWILLSPQPRYYNRKRACYELWVKLSLDKQRAIYDRIKAKKDAGRYVNYNPYFAISDEINFEPEQLSYNEYYKRFGTTEEVQGWKKQYLAAEQRTVYILNRN